MSATASTPTPRWSGNTATGWWLRTRAQAAAALDYALPRADLLPGFDTEISEVPSTTNPLGMRGGSEGGITPGLAGVATAVVDALADFGIEHIELPATPERVWKAIRAARGNRAEQRESRRAL